MGSSGKSPLGYTRISLPGRESGSVYRSSEHRLRHAHAALRLERGQALRISRTECRRTNRHRGRPLGHGRGDLCAGGPTGEDVAGQAGHDAGASGRKDAASVNEPSVTDDARWRATPVGWRTSLISASSVDTGLTLLYWRVGC